MEFVSLKTLTHGPGSGPIRVRVCRMWDSINPRLKELISLDMVVVDDESTLMWVQIRRTMAPRFRPLFTVGSVYVVSNYNVSQVTGGYRPVDWPYRLSFTIITTVRRFPTPVPEIPIHAFHFAQLPAIMSRVNDNSILRDIAGCLVTVCNAEPVSGGFLKRDLLLASDISAKFKVTLWAEDAENFVEAYNVREAQSPLVFVFSSMKVKQYSGDLVFSTTGTSQVFVNLDHTYVRKLAAMFASTVPVVDDIAPRINLQESVEASMFHNRKTISDIMSGSWSHERPGYKMTFLGEVSDVSTNYGWFYFGCKLCHRKVAIDGDKYTCAECELVTTSPVILYKIMCHIKDDTSALTCILLNKVAERMLDSSPMKFFNRLAPVNPEFPPEILQLRGTSHIFMVRLSDYNLNYGGEVFSICDVFTPDPQLELKHASGLPKENGPFCIDVNTPDDDPKGKAINDAATYSTSLIDGSTPKKRLRKAGGIESDVIFESVVLDDIDTVTNDNGKGRLEDDPAGNEVFAITPDKMHPKRKYMHVSDDNDDV